MTEFTHTNLVQLWIDIENDPAFDHMRQFKNPLVPGEGSNPYIMVIGEAPGRTEAMQRRPFVGQSGGVLVQLMKLAGLSRTRNSWVTNVVKYRPTISNEGGRNRTPTRAEVLASVPYLRREWTYIYKPKVVIAVGSVAWEAVGGYVRYGALTSLAGKPKHGKQTGYIVPMLHPAYGIRNESVRDKMERHWVDLYYWLSNQGVPVD